MSQGPGACREHVIYEYVPMQAPYSPGNSMTQEMNLMCVSHEELSVKRVYFQPHSRSRALSLSLQFEPKHSPPSQDDIGSIKDYFTALKPWQRPSWTNTNWIGASVGGSTDYLGPRCFTTGSFRRPRTPKTLLPRPITPNHHEW
ncbi:WD repeat-containing protein 76 [Dissostichus eleginoides]|uniref:WD repeat-containing protein 76 n=1 Tax=Dissostichus eleginoides TaxID=100907 RepID=A0AAD9F0M1_DISEL|nr:WD repeat-containing protein 76 [Dissostichus eleginoides]